jgi:hypothetical protein
VAPKKALFGIDPHIVLFGGGNKALVAYDTRTLQTVSVQHTTDAITSIEFNPGGFVLVFVCAFFSLFISDTVVGVFCQVGHGDTRQCHQLLRPHHVCSIWKPPYNLY